jgi:hypothetical protein
MPDVIPQGTLAVGQYASSTKVTVQSVAATRAVPAGRSVLVSVVVEGAASPTAHSFTATDAKGNTYTQLDNKNDAGGSSRQVALLLGQIGTALASGDSITITDTTASRGKWAITVEEFTGLQASPLDVHSEGTAVNQAAMTVGPTSTPSVSSILAFGAWSHGPANTFTAPSGWAAGASELAGATSSDQHLSTAYLVTAPGSPAAITAAATQSAGSDWAGVLVVLKAAATQNLTASAVSFVGTGWTKVPTSGATDAAILNDNDPTTYHQSPDNPTGTQKIIVTPSTPSPLPGSTDTVSYTLDCSGPGSSSASITAVVKSGGTTRETFSGLTVPLSGGLVTITLASATVAAITSATQWGSVTIEYAETATP